MKPGRAARVGWPYREVAPGKPKAHFSFNRDTWLAASPAAFAGSKRPLVASTPQPFHAGAADKPVMGGLLRQALGIFTASPALAAIKFRPPRYSAMARRSSPAS